MRRLIQNLVFFIAAGTMASTGHGTETIQWETDLTTAFRQAEATGRPLLLHFWTNECVPCKRLEHTVFNQPLVAGTLHDFFVPVKINANQHPELAARYRIKSVPNDVIVTADDRELHRMFTPQDPRQYVAQLSAIAFKSGSTRSARTSTPRADAQSDSRLSNDRRWAERTREIDKRARYQENRSSYSAESTEIAPSVPIDTRQSAAPTGEPKEVINRYARRREQSEPTSGPSQSEPNLENNAAADAPRWGGWPTDPNSAATGRSAMPAPSTSPTAPNSRYSPQRSEGQRPTATTPHLTNPRNPMPVDRSAKRKPPLGLDGYCPVSLVEKNSWTKGDPRFGVIHRGRVYLFSSQEEKDQFFADPDEYSPVLAGVDPVRLSTTGNAIMGQRAHGVVYRKRVYLFSSEETLQEFWKDPEVYASPIRQAMESGNVERLFR